MGYVFWAINFILFGLIVWRGWQEGSLRAYPAFFGYAMWSLAAATAGLAVMSIYGEKSWAYYHSYHVPNLAVPLWHLAILASLYALISQRDSTAPQIVWALGFTLLFSTPIMWKLWSMQGPVYLRFHMVALPAQVVACFLVYLSAIRNRHLKLGHNVHFLMLGLGIMVGLQSLNFLQYFGKFQSFQSFRTFVPLIYTLALSTFAVGLWRYDPPRFSAEDAVRIRRLESSLIRSMATLLRRLFART